MHLQRVLRTISCLFLFLLSPMQAKQPNFVTYEFSGGRFGDNLLSYLHAKWISYQYQIPLLYKPFPYAGQLILHDTELHYNPNSIKQYEKIYVENDFGIKSISQKMPQLFVCAYFPECPWERATFLTPTEKKRCFKVNWKDPGFRTLVKQMIQSKTSHSLSLPPPGQISIALHIREGGGYDIGNFNLGFMTKFPPIEFYIQGLLEVIKHFPGKPLYCHLFTDALNPIALMETLKTGVPEGTQIQFDCRKRNNAHNENVLEDFFSFFHYDVLIHPQSNFSIIPSLIHDYAMTFAPLSAIQQGSNVIIDKVTLTMNEELCKKLNETAH